MEVVVVVALVQSTLQSNYHCQVYWPTPNNLTYTSSVLTRVTDILWQSYDRYITAKLDQFKPSRCFGISLYCDVKHAIITVQLDQYIQNTHRATKTETKGREERERWYLISLMTCRSTSISTSTPRHCRLVICRKDDTDNLIMQWFIAPNLELELELSEKGLIAVVFSKPSVTRQV